MRTAVSFFSLSLAAAIAGCSSPATENPTGSGEDAATAVSIQPIIGGTPAVEYPEAAVLDIDRGTSGVWYACSATVIAPRVVLTAGHCVDTHHAWTIYAHGEMRVATGGLTYDWAENGSEKVNPLHHDLGLVFFDEPIILASYPTIPTSSSPDGTRALNLGRILNGTLTSASYEAPATISSALFRGFPFDYTSADVIQSGDSGGAVMVLGTHQLVAVNSGSGSGYQVLARTDLLASWIKSQIAAHPVAAAPTPAPAPTPTPTTKPSAAPTPSPTYMPKPPVVPSPSATAPDAGPPPPPPCPAETEVNDEPASANLMSGNVCGALGSASDVDWFNLTAAPGVTTIALSASSDATFAIGTAASGKCNVIATGQKSVRVTVSGGPAALCAQIASPSHAKQSYAFTTQK